MAKPMTTDTVHRVLSRLPQNPRIVMPGNAGTPRAMLDLIDSHLESVTYSVLNPITPFPQREGATLETTFVGPGMRRAPNLRYVPCRLSMLPVLFRHSMRPDVVILHTSTPRDDVVSLGVEVDVLPAAIEAARVHGGVVIAVANPSMPHTLGDAIVDLDDIDFLVEIDEPLMAFDAVPADDNELRIGQSIAEHVQNGSTLQLGIGGVPDAVLQAITAARGLRIWSETISDGILALERAGAMDKNTAVRPSFMMGSQDLYDWADNNPRLTMIRTERCNDPALISKQYGMTSVNGALQVDLHAQANASRIKGRIYSGFGGSTDFIIGALHAPAGQSFLALPSWHPKANKSTIVSTLDGPVTSFQPTAVATEQGIAWLLGASEHGQARHLIEKAAHPDARDGLLAAAKSMGLA